MEQNSSFRRLVHVLPPGTELLNHEIYGFMTIKLGKLLWLRTPSILENLRAKVKFWGEEGGAVMIPSNIQSAAENVSNLMEYEIHCSEKNFHKYLLEMKKLNFHLVDSRNGKAIGVTTLNLDFYLRKPELTANSPFENNIRETMVIMTLNNSEKIGELEVFIDAEFYPSKEMEEPKVAVRDPSTEKKRMEPPNYIDVDHENCKVSILTRLPNE